jgi:hypothetical protein
VQIILKIKNPLNIHLADVSKNVRPNSMDSNVPPGAIAKMVPHATFAMGHGREIAI